MALLPGLPGRASTRKVKPIWILLKQETVSGSGISWNKLEDKFSKEIKTDLCVAHGCSHDSANIHIKYLYMCYIFLPLFIVIDVSNIIWM